MSRHPGNPPAPNRGSPEVTERARETLAWMEARTTAGEPVGEDDVWGFVTTRWPGIATGFAEHVLNTAMGWHAAATAPSEPALRAAVFEALRGMCDGSYSDDPEAWTLEIGTGRGWTATEFADAMAKAVRERLLAGPETEPAPGPR